MNTKELILEKTLKLMIEKHNSIISIREISDATGISIGGIYYYFSSKEDIYYEITKRYIVDYYKFNMEKLRQIRGNVKERIHDVMVEIFNQMQNGIKIETIGDEIDYRIILMILTPNVYNYDNITAFYKSVLKEMKECFIEIIDEGQKNRQIRQDLPAIDIAESLIILYLGIHYNWELGWIDDMISTFEDIFDLEWEKIRLRE